MDGTAEEDDEEDEDTYQEVSYHHHHHEDSHLHWDWCQMRIEGDRAEVASYQRSLEVVQEEAVVVGASSLLEEESFSVAVVVEMLKGRWRMDEVKRRCLMVQSEGCCHSERCPRGKGNEEEVQKLTLIYYYYYS